MNDDTNAPDTQARVRAALHSVLGEAITSVPATDDLAEALDGRYDSLTAMECITAVEQAFDIEVDFVAHDVRYWFATVERMTQFVRNEMEDRALLGSGR